MSGLKVPSHVVRRLLFALLIVPLFLCFRSKDSVGWELIFSTPYLHNTVERMALNAKVSSSSFGDKMLAVSSGWFIKTF